MTRFLPARRYRPFLFWFASGLAVVLAVVAAINLTIDPAGLFRPPLLEKRIGEELAHGRTFRTALGTPYRDRLIQKSVIDALPAAPDTIVLGSSRAGQIRADMLIGDRAFNHWVSSAVLEDQLAILNLYRVRGWRAKTVYMAIDPWLFNQRHGVDRWTQLRDDVSEILAVLALPGLSRHAQSRPNLAAAAISRAYLGDSLRYIQSYGMATNTVYDFGDDDRTPQLAMRPDGSFKPRDEELGRDASALGQQAIHDARSGILYCAEYAALDPFYQQAFRAAVEWLQGNGSRVVFVLPPFQPDYWNAVQGRPEMERLREADNFIRNFALSRAISVVGSWDATLAGCRADQFYDSNHPREECMRAILATVPAQAPPSR